MRFNTALMRFDTASMRFDTALMRFYTAMMRFDTAMMRFDSAMMRLDTAMMRFDSAMMRFDSAMMRFDSAIKAAIKGWNSSFISMCKYLLRNFEVQQLHEGFIWRLVVGTILFVLVFIVVYLNRGIFSPCISNPSPLFGSILYSHYVRTTECSLL